MGSRILNILSKTTQVSTEELLQGVINATTSAVHTAGADYHKLDKPALLEMIDFMCEIMDRQSTIALKEDYLLSIVDDVCITILPGIEAAVYGSQSKQSGIDSQLHQSMCKLLSLCTVAVTTVKPSSPSVRGKLLGEYISALKAYKSEVGFSIVGDERTHLASEKHLGIQTAMEIIDVLLERKLKATTHQQNNHQSSKVDCQSITSEWIQGCFDCLLDMLPVCQTNVSSRLTGVILPKILQIEPDLCSTRCDDIWKRIIVMNASGNSVETNTNVFITLCGLVNYFIPYQSGPSVVAKIEFWIMIQLGLVHSDPLARKQAAFLLKRAIELCSLDSSATEDLMVIGGDGSLLFQWSLRNRKQLLGIWDDFFLLYETLAEVQVIT